MQSIQLADDDQGDSVDRAADGSVIRTIRVKQVDVAPAESAWGEVEPADLALVIGETSSIAASDLPTERPLRLDLVLPAALADAAALSTRITSMDGGRELALPDAVIATDRSRARVEVERGWLSPGRYRIELRASEGPPFVQRRYLLEIR